MDKKDEQAIEAVRLYFERGFSQAEVAATMGISRPTVAKLLLRGKEAGFVTVTIHDPRETSSVLGEHLARRFGLAEARVIHNSGASERDILDDLGRVGARLVESLVEDGMSVGVSWGRTMNAIASHLRRTVRRHVEVVQLKGGTAHSSEATNDFEVMRAFCEAFTALPRYLPLPVIFEDVRTLDIVRSDPYIASILEAGQKTDLVVFTVGEVTPESLAFSHAHLKGSEAHQLLASAVGDACSRFFTAEGEVAVPSIDERTAGISLRDLVSRPLRVLVAGGPKKAAACATALRMGMATHLVVDQDLARVLLAESERT